MEPYTACPTTVKTAGAPDINILHPLHRLQDYFEPFSVALRLSTVIYHADLGEVCHNIGEVCHNIGEVCHNIGEVCHNIGEVCHNIGCCLYRLWRAFLSPTASHQSLTCIASHRNGLQKEGSAKGELMGT
jgi:hypothetical protein